MLHISLSGDDSLYDSLTLTSPNVTTVNIHGGSGSCSLRVLVVGGGGDATGQLEGDAHSEASVWHCRDDHKSWNGPGGVRGHAL